MKTLQIEKLSRMVEKELTSIQKNDKRSYAKLIVQIENYAREGRLKPPSKSFPLSKRTKCIQFQIYDRPFRIHAAVINDKLYILNCFEKKRNDTPLQQVQNTQNRFSKLI